MTQASKKKTARKTRRVADTVLDIAIGGPALAADKARETIDKVVEAGQDAVRKGRQAAEERASTVKETVRAVSQDQDGRVYEDRTRDELYELATERGIEGRSSMVKAELIAALRAQS